MCSPYFVNSAFWPVIDNFERALAFTRDEPTDSKLDKLEALVVTHYGRPLADVRLSQRSCPSRASNVTVLIFRRELTQVFHGEVTRVDL
jgi:hypothetical protein